MVDEHYQPIPHEKIRIGENFVDVELELLNTNSIRNVIVKGKNEAKVLDISILINKRKGKLTAWNILAEFLYFLLKGKEVIKLLKERKNKKLRAL
uniref:Uncharacterized protein n=1 Tax=Meloidogyne enterolobii TaxID=390850 RepID=A0A6V7VSA4_MELEN|nr:unnamed protein product [Meloidogyne enterolobii]